MIVNEILGYYKELGENEKRWLLENVDKMPDDEQMNFMTALKDLHKSRDGAPEISEMTKALQKVTGKRAKLHVWNVCLECGCEFAFGLPLCPACYEKQLECRSFAVRKSDFPPPMKVIRYNKEYLGDGSEQNCYACEHKEMSFCQNFGNVKWQCKDFRNCNCAGCCVKAKNANKALQEKKVTFTYAKPFGGTK